MRDIITSVIAGAQVIIIALALSVGAMICGYTAHAIWTMF